MKTESQKADLRTELFVALCSEQFEKTGQYRWAAACALEVSNLARRRGGRALSQAIAERIRSLSATPPADRPPPPV